MKLFGSITRRFRRRTKLVLPRREAADPEVMADYFDGATAQPLWRGMDVLLDRMALERVQEAIDPKMSDAEAKFHLGGAAFAAEFKARMLEQVALAEERARKA